MPDLNTIPPDDLKYFRAQGYTDAEIQASYQPPQQQVNPQMSGFGAIKARLLGNAGGNIGGGIGMMGGAEAGAGIGALIPGAEPVTVPVGGIIGGIIGGLGGGYLGQKGQEAILPEQLQQELQQQSQLAAEQHPFVSGATDLTAAMMAGGMRPSISNLKNALIGDTGAMVKVGTGALLNPAVQTGVSLAQGQGIPSMKELGESALGGALFSEQSALGKGVHKMLGGEPTPETSSKTTTDADNTTGEGQETTKPATTIWNETTADGKYKLSDEAAKDAYRNANYTKIKGLGVQQRAEAVTKNAALKEMLMSGDVEQMRDWLHQTELAKQQPVVPAATTEDILGTKQQDDFGQMPENRLPQMEGQEADTEPEPVNQRAIDFRKAKLEDLQQEGLGTDVARQPVLPRVNPVVEEAKVRDRLALQDNTQPKTPAELAEEQFERTGSVRSEQTPQHQNYSPEDLAKNQMAIDRQNHGGTLTPKSVVSEMYKPGATNKSVIRAWANTDHEYAPLMKSLLSMMHPSDEVPLTVSMKDIVDPTARSAFYPPNSSEGVPNSIEMMSLAAHNSDVAVEEIIHSLMAAKNPGEMVGLRGNEWLKASEKYARGKDANPALVDLHNIYKTVAKNKGIYDKLFTDRTGFHDDATSTKEIIPGLSGAPDDAVAGGLPYHMGSFDEFTAGLFKKRDFQYELNEMPSGLKDNRTMWQRVVDAISHLLGFDVKQGSMLDRALRSAGELIHQERPEEGGGKEALRSSAKEEPRRKENEIPLKESNLPLGFNKLFRSGLDTIRSLAHPDATHVADSLQNVFQKRENLLGQQLNPIIAKAKELGITDRSIDGKTVQNLGRWMRENRKIPDRSQFGNDRQYELFNTIRKSLEDNYNNRVRIQEPVVGAGGARMPKRDPYYWPTTTNPKVANVIRDNTDVEGIAKAKDTFIDHQIKLGQSKSDAQQNWKDYSRAVQGSSVPKDTGSGNFFNGARRPEGIPLSPEFTRPGLLNNLESYFHAQATDNAYYEHVEKDPRTMAALGYTKDAWGRKVPESENGVIIGNTAVKNVVNEIRGESLGGLQGQTIAKSESLATAGILGPLTEWHKVASNMFKALSGPESPIIKAKAIYNAMTNFSDAWTHVKETGKLVMTAKSATDMWASGMTAADRLSGLARGMRQIYTLNDLTDKFNLGALQAINEITVPAKIQAANEGSIAAQLTMRHLDPSWVKGKEYSPQEISQLASNLTGIIHGTRDARTMPSWMLHDNEISAFFKLSSWGIAQTNSFVRDVYTPATKGEYLPLLNAAFGAFAGGYILKTIREELAGKKSQIPSLGEIAASYDPQTGKGGFKDNIPAVAYNMMAASSYAGFGGMISTFSRFPFDVAFKNQSQGATFPLDEYVSDIATTLHQVGVAIANDPNVNWLHLAEQVGTHLMMTNFQLGRVAMNHAIDEGLITGLPADKKALSDKMNQLRRFDMVSGLPYNEIDSSSNPYMNIEQKKFKYEQDPQKAMQMLPSLVQNIFQTYSDKPDVMLSKLKALKENQYATFPSMETMPLSFMRYMSFLARDKGPVVAQQEFMDYMKHKMVNELKSSVVP